jgi:hypothetical protein
LQAEIERLTRIDDIGEYEPVKMGAAH